MVFNAFSIASTSTFAEIGSGYDYGDGNDINNYTPGTAGGPGGRDRMHNPPTTHPPSGGKWIGGVEDLKLKLS